MEIISKFDNIIVSNKNKGWSGVTSIDFGGANVSISGYSGQSTHILTGNPSITSFTNAVINHTNAGYLCYRFGNLQEFSADMSKVITAKSAFGGCSSLTTCDCGGCTPAEASGMFSGCSALTTVRGLDYSQITNASGMFTNCTALTDVGNVDFSQMVSAGGMFNGCRSLTGSLHIDAPHLVNCTSMFNACSSLTSVYLDAPIATAVSSFNQCSSLTDLTIIVPSATVGLSLPSTTALTSVTIDNSGCISSRVGVTNCSGLTYFALTAGWSGTSGTSYSKMLPPSLKHANLSFPNAERLKGICSDAIGLESVVIDAPNCTEYAMMFQKCSALTSVTIVHPETIVNASSMFKACSSLTDTITYLPNAINVNNMYDDAKGLAGSYTFNLPSASGVDYFLSYATHYVDEPDTDITLIAPSATTARYALQYLRRVKSIDAQLSAVTSAQNMCDGCSALTSIQADLRSLTAISSFMFRGCDALKNVGLIVNNSLSAHSASFWSIPSGAPCNAHKYVDDLGDGTVRLTYTDTAR